MWSMLMQIVILPLFQSLVPAAPVWIIFSAGFISLVIYDFSWPTILSYYFLLDSVNMFLIFMTIWLSYVMMVDKKNKIYVVYSILILTLCMFFTFLVGDLILFYLAFELSLIPITFMIYTWGLQPERLLAANYFLIYALLGSFPLLAKMVYISMNLGSLSMFLLFNMNLEFFFFFFSNKLLVLFWSFAFLMKLPVYILHLWLPKAHVEAPVYGSMFLAAVLLKLGAYGLIRLSYFYLVDSTYFLWWLMFSSIIMCLIAYRSYDIKSLIAYSSIIHMVSMVMLVFFYNQISNLACLLMVVGHGFVSSGLFFVFNLFYNLSHSRNIFLKKGSHMLSSLFLFFFFFLLILKASLPMSLTFFSEAVVGLAYYLINGYSLMFFIISVFLVGLYKINLFLSLGQGGAKVKLSSYTRLSSDNSSFILSFHIFIKFFCVFFLYKFF